MKFAVEKSVDVWAQIATRYDFAVAKLVIEAERELCTVYAVAPVNV